MPSTNFDLMAGLDGVLLSTGAAIAHTYNIRLWCKLALVMRWAGLCRIEGPQRESSGKRRVPLFRHRRFPFPELACLELTLLDLLRQLDSADGDCRVVEAFESQHRPDPLFDSAVVLFDEIVQVLARSHFYSTRKFAGLLHLSHGAMRRRVGV